LRKASPSGVARINCLPISPSYPVPALSSRLGPEDFLLWEISENAIGKVLKAWKSELKPFLWAAPVALVSEEGRVRSVRMAMPSSALTRPGEGSATEA